MKKRLDVILLEKYPNYSRRQIQSFIMQGLVSVDDKIITKAGTQISPDSQVHLKAKEMKYVSRAGFKLEHALKQFDIDVNDLIVLDAGISTGGFTDCLLQNGAKKIYGIDVGYGQVHEKIRQDSRVKILERTNLRHLEEKDLGEKVDLITLDLSFISLLKVMPVIKNLLKPSGKLIVLIKPQFEAGREEMAQSSYKGVIKDQIVRDKIVQNVIAGIETFGFKKLDLTTSPVLGASGNQEFLGYFIFVNGQKTTI